MCVCYIFYRNLYLTSYPLTNNLGGIMLHLIIDGNSYHEVTRAGNEIYFDPCNCDEDDDIP